MCLGWLMIMWSATGCSVEAGPLGAHCILPCSEHYFGMHWVLCYCGPHIGCQFCVVGFLNFLCWGEPHSYTGPTVLKTPMLVMLLEIIIYLLLWLWGFSTITGDTQSVPSVRSQERSTDGRKRNSHRKKKGVKDRALSSLWIPPSCCICLTYKQPDTHPIGWHWNVSPFHTTTKLGGLGHGWWDGHNWSLSKEETGGKVGIGIPGMPPDNG